MRPPQLPLATLIGRELRNEKIEKPLVRHGHAGLAKKGEDYFLIKPDCERTPGNSASSFSVFAVITHHFFLILVNSKKDLYLAFSSLNTIANGRSLMGTMASLLLYSQKRIC